MIYFLLTQTGHVYCTHIYSSDTKHTTPKKKKQEQERMRQLHLKRKKLRSRHRERKEPFSFFSFFSFAREHGAREPAVRDALVADEEWQVFFCL